MGNNARRSIDTLCLQQPWNTAARRNRIADDPAANAFIAGRSCVYRDAITKHAIKEDMNRRYAQHLSFCLFAKEYGETFSQRRRFNQSLFISRDHKFIFVKNEKAANLTLRKTLQTLEAGGDLPSGYHTNRRWSGPLLQPSDIEGFGAKELQGETYFRFAVVRNPYIRLLSCFRDKFENIKFDRKFWRVHRNLGLKRSEVSISFEEFVALVCVQESAQMNPHWRIQHDNIYFDRMSFDKIVKFENLKDEMPEIIDRCYGGAASLLTRRHHGTNADVHLHQYYTEKTTKMVRQKYALDFETFGYDKNLPGDARPV